MRIRSHLDTTMFVTFIHIDAMRYDDDFRKIVNDVRAQKNQNATPLLNALKERDRRTFWHEQYHFCQGLRLPFLHYYALNALRSTLQGAHVLSQHDTDWTTWPTIPTADRGFFRLDSQSYFSANPAKQIIVHSSCRETGFPRSLKISPKEMLECAASIIDYQYTCQTPSHGFDMNRFRRWRKLHPGALSIFDFYSDFTGFERLALRTMVPIINAAMHTSIPERALCELIVVMSKFLRAKTEDERTGLLFCKGDKWRKVLDIWVRTYIHFDFAVGVYPEAPDVATTSFFHMDEKHFLGAKVGGVMHPLLGPAAKAWQERSDGDPSSSAYLDGPIYVPDSDATQWMRDVQPEVQVLRVFFENGDDRVFCLGDWSIGEAFESDSFNDTTSSEFQALILDLMAVHGAFRRSVDIKLTPAMRTCYHRNCTHYSGNFCNAYPDIPEDPSRCSFPSRLREWIENTRNMKI